MPLRLPQELSAEDKELAELMPAFEARPSEYFTEPGGLEKICVVAQFPELCASGGVPGHLTVLYVSDWTGRHGTGIKTRLTEAHAATIRGLADEWCAKHSTFALRGGCHLDVDGPVVSFRDACERDTGLPFRSTDGSDKTRAHVTAPFLSGSDDQDRTLPFRLKVTSSKLPAVRANERLAHVLLFMDATHARGKVVSATVPVTAENIDKGLVRGVPRNGKNEDTVARALAIIQHQDSSSSSSSGARNATAACDGDGQRLGGVSDKKNKALLSDDAREDDAEELRRKRLKRFDAAK
mmetsp:Transcript_12506/g.37734  ORF Transcript_12506/g.37734 Transcript_12506/m.37734 type:complete len:295 (+) Transcript_12506:15-899(+)